MLPSRAPSFCILSFLVIAAVAPTVPSAAQTVSVQNGATVRIQNDAAWNLKSGTMDLGSAGATATLSEQTGGRAYNGKLTATRALSAPSARDVAGLGAVISASVDLGNVAVTRGHQIQSANGNQGIARYYDISPSQNNSGLNATLTHHYADPEELNGLSESNLELFKSTDGGSSWSEEGAGSRDAAANTVTLSGIASFSRWTLGSTQTPLPVELAFFESVNDGGGVTLRWATASETGNAGFGVQHRRDSTGAWEELGFVESKAEGGTATEPQRYRYQAKDLGVGTNQFRLEQVDLDGSTDLSKVIEALVEMQETYRLSTQPNPATRQATVKVAVQERQTVRLALYDVLGRRVATLYDGPLPAHETRTFRLNAGRQGLPSGTYFLRINGERVTDTRRLAIVR
ncbi:T9SS type A sorting domain-containing protein [Salinibacter grassmerensis]|uniref:T9SS type A sorting domain-containing protein n=1 Tax=Salinibacter grassmerensis TaxID=3040353 RepID=UPI0021E9538D|nr:T9SS type A sorting domain-containing protein [Salinibacter grassmerensis]